MNNSACGQNLCQLGRDGVLYERVKGLSKQSLQANHQLKLETSDLRSENAVVDTTFLDASPHLKDLDGKIEQGIVHPLLLSPLHVVKVLIAVAQLDAGGDAKVVPKDRMMLDGPL